MLCPAIVSIPYSMKWSIKDTHWFRGLARSGMGLISVHFEPPLAKCKFKVDNSLTVSKQNILFWIKKIELAPSEVWTHDPWFTRPVLYHWAIEARAFRQWAMYNDITLYWLQVMGHGLQHTHAHTYKHTNTHWHTRTHAPSHMHRYSRARSRMFTRCKEMQTDI